MYNKGKQNPKCRYSIVAVCIFLMLFVVSGCGKKDTSTDATTDKKTTETLTTEEEVRELTLPRTNSFKDYDLEINQHPADCGQDIYNLDDSAWNKNNSKIVNIKQYNDTDVLLSYEDMTLVRVNAVTLEVVATCKLDERLMYSVIDISDDGRIFAYTYEYGELYDGSLQLLKTVDWPNDQMESYVVADDFSVAYYETWDTGKIYQYDIETETEKEVSFDILKECNRSNGDDVTIILVDLENNIIDFRVMIQDQISNVKCDLTTGEIIERTENARFWMENDNEMYFANDEVQGSFENFVGRIGEEPSLILAPDASMQNCAVKCLLKNKVFMLYSADEIQNDETSDHTFCMIDFDGTKKYETELSFELENAFVSEMAYLEKLGAIVFSITSDEGETNIYVWDLCGASSKSNDDETYVYPYDMIVGDNSEYVAENRKYADEIEKKYGIEIGIGDEVDDNAVFEYTIKPMENCLTIRRSLAILDRELARYPEGMIAQLQLDEGCPMWLFLCNGIYGIEGDVLNEAGGLQSESDGHFSVYINCAILSDISSTIHHELFHSIDDYLWGKENGMDDGEWSTFNPDGFIYDYNYVDNMGSSDDRYTADGNLGNEDDETVASEISFIDVYSKSYPVEDYARIMEYAMDEIYSGRNYFRYDNIRAKLEYESKKIRETFDTTGWPEVTEWEKLLTQ